MSTLLQPDMTARGASPFSLLHIASAVVLLAFGYILLPSTSSLSSAFANPALRLRSAVRTSGGLNRGPTPLAASEVDEFRRKLIDGAISGRRVEKWTSKGRQAKAIREAMQEAANESPEPEPVGDEFEEEEEEYVFEDPTTKDSFTFGDADMERAEMQPANELEDLRSRMFSTWPEKGDAFFRGKVATVFLGALTILLGLVALTSDIGVEKVGVMYAVFLAAAITTLFIFRLWIDWNYVGDRLKGAQVFYEKSGWYDGELWTKPPEVAKRDELLFNFQVKPVIDRLRPWLFGSLAFTVAAFVTLLAIRPSDPYAEVPDRPVVTQDGQARYATYATIEDDDDEEE